MAQYADIAHLALALCSLVIADSAPAQAHCALRDPDKSVYAGLPTANGYRAIQREVAKNERGIVHANLPFRVHFNELGKHTLYVALRGQLPIGVVHTRSEESLWGLVEIIWYFGLDLEIKGFRFQRCRSRYGKILERSEFAKKLRGLGYDELLDLLNSKGDFYGKKLPIPKGAENLALTIVQSALKTLLVTRAVWRQQLIGLRDLELGLDAFANGRVAYRLHVAPGKPLPFKSKTPPRHLRSLRAVRVLDERARNLGLALETNIAIDKKSITLRWSLDPAGRLVRVICRGAWPSDSVKASFGRLEGRVITKSFKGDFAERIAARLMGFVAELTESGASPK